MHILFSASILAGKAKAVEAEECVRSGELRSSHPNQ